jgi:hypothetical protein
MRDAKVTEEAHVHEELQHMTQRSLEEACMHEEVQCVMQWSIEEAHRQTELQHALRKRHMKNNAGGIATQVHKKSYMNWSQGRI